MHPARPQRAARRRNPGVRRPAAERAGRAGPERIRKPSSGTALPFQGKHALKWLDWRRPALSDRVAIMEYIAQDNPAAAIALDQDFEEHAESARKDPTLYRRGRVKGTREIVVRPNCVMVDRVGPKSVEIRRVPHAAQQWPARREVASSRR